MLTPNSGNILQNWASGALDRTNNTSGDETFRTI